MTIAQVQKSFHDARRLKWPEADLTYLALPSSTPALPPDMFAELWPLIVAMAADTSTPVDWTAHTLLVAAGSILSGRIRVRPLATANWEDAPVLWIGLVGNPSSRKTPAMTNALRPLVELEETIERDTAPSRKAWEDKQAYRSAINDKYKQDIRAAARSGKPAPKRPPALDSDREPPSRKLQVTDTSLEALCEIHAASPEGILSRHGELAGWFENMGRYNNGSDMPFWLMGYDAERYTIDRRNRESRLVIGALCLSLVGTTQPDKMNQILNMPHDGCAARILFIYPEPVPFTRPHRRADISQVSRIFHKLDEVSFLPGTNNKPRVIPFSPDADQLFSGWLTKLDRKANHAKGHYANFLGKAGGTVARVSLICEFLKAAARNDKSAPQEVSVETVNDVLKWMDDYLQPMACKAYGIHALDEAERNARLLLAYLSKQRLTHFNKRELMRTPHKAHLKGMRNAEQFDAAIELLITAKWVFRMEADQGGRRREDYAVNKRLFMA